MAMAMPYPFALPDDPYAPPAAYDAPIGRVKIQVSPLWYRASTYILTIFSFTRLTVVHPSLLAAMTTLLPGVST